MIIEQLWCLWWIRHVGFFVAVLLVFLSLQLCCSFNFNGPGERTRRKSWVRKTAVLTNIAFPAILVVSVWIAIFLNQMRIWELEWLLDHTRDHRERPSIIARRNFVTMMEWYDRKIHIYRFSCLRSKNWLAWTSLKLKQIGRHVISMFFLSTWCIPSTARHLRYQGGTVC